MAARKDLDLSGLVATKGQAQPVANVPPRSAAPIAQQPEKDQDSAGLVPMNFRVSAELRREFKVYAAEHDLKLVELLRRSFLAYKAQNGQ